MEARQRSARADPRAERGFEPPETGGGDGLEPSRDGSRLAHARRRRAFAVCGRRPAKRRVRHAVARARGPTRRRPPQARGPSAPPRSARECSQRAGSFGTAWRPSISRPSLPRALEGASRRRVVTGVRCGARTWSRKERAPSRAENSARREAGRVGELSTKDVSPLRQPRGRPLRAGSAHPERRPRGDSAGVITHMQARCLMRARSCKLLRFRHLRCGGAERAQSESRSPTLQCRSFDTSSSPASSPRRWSRV